MAYACVICGPGWPGNLPTSCSDSFYQKKSSKPETNIQNMNQAPHKLCMQTSKSKQVSTIPKNAPKLYKSISVTLSETWEKQIRRSEWIKKILQWVVLKVIVNFDHKPMFPTGRSQSITNCERLIQNNLKSSDFHYFSSCLKQIQD